MALLTYTIIEAPSEGWDSARTLVGFAVAAGLLGAFIAWQRGATEPLLDIGLFRNLRFSAASGSVTIVFFALAGFIFMVTQYFQFLKGYGPLSTGVRLLPVASSVAVTSVLGTKLAVRYGTKLVVVTGLLFLVVGMLVSRRGSALVSDFGGAGKLVPVLAGVFLIAGLASLSLPGTSPFVSEFLVLLGTFTVHKAVAVVATVGIILAAGYVLWMVQRTTQGALNPALEKVAAMRRDITAREVVVVAPLVALILVLGFYPKPVLDVINPAVKATFSQVGKVDPAPQVAQGGGK